MATLDIAPYQRRLDELNAEVIAAQQAFNAAAGRLGDFRSQSQSEIAARIKAGESTGDSLLDECLSCFSFGDPLVASIRELGAKLVEAKGERCLLTFTWQTRIRWGGPGDSSERDYMPSMGYVYGTLSGERLRILPGTMGSHAFGFAFPFERHIKLGIDDKPDPERPAKGEYLLTDCLGLNGPSVLALMDYLAGRPTEACMIEIGASAERLPFGRLKILDNPTEDEAIAATGI